MTIKKFFINSAIVIACVGIPCAGIVYAWQVHTTNVAIRAEQEEKRKQLEAENKREIAEIFEICHFSLLGDDEKHQITLSENNPLQMKQVCDTILKSRISYWEHRVTQFDTEAQAAYDKLEHLNKIHRSTENDLWVYVRHISILKPQRDNALENIDRFKSHRAELALWTPENSRFKFVHSMFNPS